MTLVCHVDDINVSYMNSEVVDEIIQYLKKIYQNLIKGWIWIDEDLAIKYHDYLGMHLYLSVPGKIQFVMINCIDNMFKVFIHHDPGCINS